ncbi:MAG: hypothetical protein IJF92_05690 [Bacilli bacterium]|nr:hypothetical protein [Bacilli bacterium]
MNRREKSKNNELRNLRIQTRRKGKKELVNWRWIRTILLISFMLSIFLSFISEISIKKSTLIVSIIITLLFIFLGIIFDIIGVSVTAGDESVFHSMSSRKVKSANVAVKFKKNADKVSSFCCDVVGDICGVVSGASGIAITTILVKDYSFDILITTLIVTGIISSLTIGGKALGKSFAINKSNIILYEFSKVVSIFYKCK